MGLPRLNQYKARINVSRTQHSDAGEARTHNPSVLSQTLYHWASTLPHNQINQTAKLWEVFRNKQEFFNIWDLGGKDI